MWSIFGRSSAKSPSACFNKIEFQQTLNSGRVGRPGPHGRDLASVDASEQNRTTGLKSARIAQVCPIVHAPAAKLCGHQIDECSGQDRETREDEGSDFGFRGHRLTSWECRYFS